MHVDAGSALDSEKKHRQAGWVASLGGQPLRYINTLYIDTEGEDSNCERG